MNSYVRDIGCRTIVFSVAEQRLCYYLYNCNATLNLLLNLLKQDPNSLFCFLVYDLFSYRKQVISGCECFFLENSGSSKGSKMQLSSKFSFCMLILGIIHKLSLSLGLCHTSKI